MPTFWQVVKEIRSMLPLPPPPPPLAALLPPCCSDVALIEFLRALDKQQAAHEKFIVEGDLGDTHLLVKVRCWVGHGREARGKHTYVRPPAPSSSTRQRSHYTQAVALCAVCVRSAAG